MPPPPPTNAAVKAAADVLFDGRLTRLVAGSVRMAQIREDVAAAVVRAYLDALDPEQVGVPFGDAWGYAPLGVARVIKAIRP